MIGHTFGRCARTCNPSMRRERERAIVSQYTRRTSRPRNSRFRWAGIGRLRRPPRGPLRPAVAILPGA